MTDKAAVLPVGENVAGTLDAAGILHLVIDTKVALYTTQPKLDKDSGKMRGGGNIMVATTRAPHTIPGTNFTIGLNLYRPA